MIIFSKLQCHKMGIPYNKPAHVSHESKIKVEREKKNLVNIYINKRDFYK